MTYTHKLSRRLAAIHDTVPALRPLVILLLILLATACGSGELINPGNPNSPEPGQPAPGWLSVVLVTPHTDDGVVQIVVSGPSIDSARTMSGHGVATVTAGSARILAVGSVASGAIAKVWVRDIRNASQYLGTVEQAAARGSYQLRTGQGYTVMVAR